MISVVYMVAGMSSRFGGKIKQFARIGKNKETLIEVSIQQAINAGFDKIIFIVGEKTEKPFKEMFGDNYKGIPIEYAKQTLPNNRDKPWGTCDALVKGKNVINSDFVVCNGDDIYGEQTFRKIKEFCLKNKEDCATIGYLLKNVLPEKGAVNRGIFVTDENNYLKEINENLNIEKNNLEKNNLSEKSLASMNIFFLRKDILPMLEEKLTKFKREHEGDRKSECYLPTELSNLINEGKIKIKLLTTPDKWLGVTSPEDEEIVKKELAKQ